MPPSPALNRSGKKANDKEASKQITTQKKEGEDFVHNSMALSDFLIRKDDFEHFSRQGSDFFYGIKTGQNIVNPVD